MRTRAAHTHRDTQASSYNPSVPRSPFPARTAAEALAQASSSLVAALLSHGISLEPFPALATFRRIETPEAEQPPPLPPTDAGPPQSSTAQPSEPRARVGGLGSEPEAESAAPPSAGSDGGSDGSDASDRAPIYWLPTFPGKPPAPPGVGGLGGHETYGERVAALFPQPLLLPGATPAQPLDSSPDPGDAAAASPLEAERSREQPPALKAPALPAAPAAARGGGWVQRLKRRHSQMNNTKGVVKTLNALRAAVAAPIQRLPAKPSSTEPVKPAEQSHDIRPAVSRHE